jgi:altronate dehydratase
MKSIKKLTVKPEVGSIVMFKSVNGFREVVLTKVGKKFGYGHILMSMTNNGPVIDSRSEMKIEFGSMYAESEMPRIAVGKLAVILKNAR